MRNLVADLRFALRTLAKSPVFTGVAVLSLALGIGANTAIFSLLDQILLRLLPVQRPEELVLLTMRGSHYGSNWGGNAISYPMYRDFKDHTEVFSGMFCRFPLDTSLTFENQTERVQAELVSGTYFSLLGVGSAVGRTITPDDDRTPSGHPLVVLSYDYWKTRFAGCPSPKRAGAGIADLIVSTRSAVRSNGCCLRRRTIALAICRAYRSSP